MTTASNHSDILSGVFEIIKNAAQLSALDENQDFYEAGVTSLMTLQILLDLESRFDVSIPDDRFIATRTVRRVTDLIAELKGQ